MYEIPTIRQDQPFTAELPDDTSKHY